MKPITFAGIQRYTLFSPNHVGNDSAIFMAVGHYLMEAGHQVNYYTEQEFLAHSLSERFVFTMMRSKAAVRHLQQAEQGGVIAVNSAYGIENCTRERMTTLLIENQIPHPESLMWDTSDPIPTYLIEPVFEPCWVKRADFHAIHREDVSYVRTCEELQEVMAEYALRGIGRVVINRHLEGDLIKFYGVSGTDFFYWFYPYDGHHSKFGLEEINGSPTGIPFSLDHLKELCDAAAKVLQVQVYGGDCIVSPDGTIRIIDFNDWPSFAPCRKEAAIAIGQSILDQVKTQIYE
ncbi:hypothetical protein [Bacteroides neonati]|uniref:hypothetical protein n=1 Tax=Bacteroides neonati TaxID=1347393 RepID=UPI0004B38669|nr:hypothetical protein [Bacteroides neonati]